MMNNILRFINSLSLTFWIGSIFFFSLCAAPSIFKILPRNLAGDLVADIFPKYYLLGYVCGILFLCSLVLLMLRGYESFSIINYLKLLLIVIMLGFSVYAGSVLRHQVSDAKTEMREQSEGTLNYRVIENRFKSLHRRSAIINVFVFVCGIAIVFINTYNYKVK